jgi:YD repeat-containing protein
MTETDSDGDGDIDSRSRSRTLGNLGVSETDTDADGQYDTRLEFVRNSDGVMISRRSYSVPELTLRSSVEVTYDGENLVRREMDNDGDGNVELVTTYTYYEDGTLMQSREEGDNDDDGQVDSLRVRNHDAMGRVVSDERDNDDAGLEFDESDTYTYVGNTIWNRSFEDGVELYSERTSYDDDNLTKIERDNDGDGEFDGELDEIIDLLYDETGRQISETYDGRPPDGMPDSELLFSYDDDGNLIYLVQQTAEEVVLFSQTWEYDEDGNQTLQSDDGDGDGLEDSRTEWEYDDDGNLLEERRYQDDVLTFRTSTEYDDDGNVTRQAYDDDGDLDDDSVTLFDYEDGKLVRERRDDDGDGNFDAITTYSQLCDAE